MSTTRLPAPDQAASHLRAHQATLAAKRSAAFKAEVTSRQIRAVYADWRGDQPHLPAARYVAPIRANAPRCGDSAYEPESVAPEGRIALALCVIGVCGVVLVGLIWVGLRWRSGIGW